MIRVYTPQEVPQGSDKWHEVRNGLITGTDAYDLLMGKSVQEILRNKKAQHFYGNWYTRRGHYLEDEGREIYAQTHSKVTPVGFVVNSEYPKAGYSPDGFTKEGLWEHKAFNETKHLVVYESLTPQIIAQTQFGMLICNKPWCDLVLYNPSIEEISKCFLVRRLFPNPLIQNRLKTLLS